MADLTDEEAAQAKVDLQAAVTRFFEVVEPGVYVAGWILITHKESINLASEDKSAVGVLQQTGLAFPMARGLLEIGVDSLKAAAESTSASDFE